MIDIIICAGHNHAFGFFLAVIAVGYKGGRAEADGDREFVSALLCLCLWCSRLGIEQVDNPFLHLQMLHARNRAGYLPFEMLQHV